MRRPWAHDSWIKPAATIAAVALLSLAAVLSASTFGEQPVSVGRAFTDPTSIDATILFSLRLPRAILAALVGAGLAASGCALQTLMRNPLADPFVLGVSGGAALGATLALAFGLGSLGELWPGPAPAGLASLSAPSLFAFLGALAAMVLVLSIARSRRSPYVALLAGVILNAFAAAAITCIKTLSSPERVGTILYWLAGTLGYERPSTLAAQAVLQIIALGTLWLFSGKLNLLQLGDDEASSLGVSVARTRFLLLLAVSLSVAGAVAVSGLIGFVGLIVPHVLRLLAGPDQRLLLPLCAFSGAAFLALSDLGARFLFLWFRTEPPVGVVTALIGGPVFLLLLRRGGG